MKTYLKNIFVLNLIIDVLYLREKLNWRRCNPDTKVPVHTNFAEALDKKYYLVSRLDYNIELVSLF
jgi:hypothetical protein